MADTDLPLIPDSALARQATELVAQLTPPFLFNHVQRTFLFADLIGRRSRLKYDRELLYLASLTHDLGLVSQFDGPARFELLGADASKTFLLEHGLAAEKAELVWDAIALHTSTEIALRKQPEVALVCIGTSLDVAGFQANRLDKTVLEAVAARYPRLNFKQAVTELFVEHIRRRPSHLSLSFMADIARVKCPEVPLRSWEQLLENSPFAE